MHMFLSMENVADAAGELGSFAHRGDDYEVELMRCQHTAKNMDATRNNQAKRWFIARRKVDPLVLPWRW